MSLLLRLFGLILGSRTPTVYEVPCERELRGLILVPGAGRHPMLFANMLRNAGFSGQKFKLVDELPLDFEKRAKD